MQSEAAGSWVTVSLCLSEYAALLELWFMPLV